MSKRAELFDWIYPILRGEVRWTEDKSVDEMINNAVDEAVADERETCAKIADEWEIDWQESGDKYDERFTPQPWVKIGDRIRKREENS